MTSIFLELSKNLRREITSLVSYFKERIRLASQEGFASPTAHKLLLLSLCLLLVPLLGLGVLTNRLSSNLALLLEWGKIEALPRIYNSDLPPIFGAIAACESGGRHYDENGRVVRGRKNRHDIGLYQINEIVHKTAIKKTGLDIYTEEGNTAFAAYLYEAAGLDPWRLSRSCWRKYL